MIDYQPFLQALTDEESGPVFKQWLGELPRQIAEGLSERRYGDLPRWKAVLNALPDWRAREVNLSGSAVAVHGEAPDQAQLNAFREQLKGLHPWRKGPFNLFGVAVDTEWRSDWKWNRLADRIAPLEGRRVLDVGCGSGYHCWRMRGAGADRVVGIDPTPLFVVQFFTLQKYIQDHRVTVLPLGVQHLPDALRYFDTVFSMGILYHRRSPFDHLIKLRDTLRAGGELVLETLVIDGVEGEVLVPEGRYARMGNVWFLPSCPTLISWMKKVGFTDIQLLDVSATTTEEQRRTEWMTFHSLEQFLDPEDKSLTVEGYPAPKRAIVTAKAP